MRHLINKNYKQERFSISGYITFPTSPATLPFINIKLKWTRAQITSWLFALSWAFKKWIPITISLSGTHAHTHYFMGLPKGREHRGCGIAFGWAFWITAVTLLKCLNEGFLRGSGLGQCLHWQLRHSTHKPVWFGHWALAQGGTWAPRRDSQD